MQRPIITTMPQMFRFQTSDWDIDWREQSTGTTVAGRRNIRVGLLPRWVSAPNVTFTPDLIPQWRAHRWTARGMTGIYRIEMCDPLMIGRSGDIDGPTFADGSRFSDGTTFADEMAIRCDAGASAGDNVITLNMASANGPIAVGQILSHNDWPFGITAIYGDEVRIEMPLRRDIPAGDLVNLRGVGLFEMTQPNAGNPAYDHNRIARTSLPLREWLR